MAGRHVWNQDGDCGSPAQPVLENRTILSLFVALLLVTLASLVTAGSVWHHHQNSTETNCPICHLNHQPFEPPLTGNPTRILAPIGLQAEVQDLADSPAPVIPRLPARAPPIE